MIGCVYLLLWLDNLWIFWIIIFVFSSIAEFGLEDENLSKEEMVDLLKALNNSKSSVKEDELLRQNVCNN